MMAGNVMHLFLLRKWKLYILYFVLYDRKSFFNRNMAFSQFIISGINVELLKKQDIDICF